MTTRKNKKNTTKYLDPGKFFHHKMVLNQWLISRFGIDPLSPYKDNGKEMRPLFAITKNIKEANQGLSTDRHHFYLHALLRHHQPNWCYSEEQLKRFDANIVAALDEINKKRKTTSSPTIDWKYFQWLSLLFIEIYLFEYFNNRGGLIRSLNNHVHTFNQFHKLQGVTTGIENYTPSDLNKICLQNATGSGKTLLMHANILQFKHYARQFAQTNEYGAIIVISPNERLTEQHMQELTASNIYNERLVQGGDLVEAGRKSLDTVMLTEITKLDNQQGVKKMAVDSFGDTNLLLVDEGHRGISATNDEKGWISYRNKLAGNGFTFEYSATFKEAIVAAKDTTTEAAYAKSIIFDYSYRYFYEDGYGKDYRIFNLPNDIEHAEHKRNYLCAALLAFYQQRILYDEKKFSYKSYNLTSPLWVFVGASVIGEDKEGREKKLAAKDYFERASDVAEILLFFGWFLSESKKAIVALDMVLQNNAKKTGLIDADGRDIFGSSFPYLKEQHISGNALYKDICLKVFHSSGGGLLTIERIAGDSGELLLKVAENETPFGLINVGDAKGLADYLEAMFIKQKINYINVEKSEFANPIFAQVTLDSSPINLLIGSRKFIEGWNCWRVSSMGLMNTGKKEGSQIIQLFGRGVRLKGKKMSLMRTSRYQPINAPQYIYLLETLNVFGVGAEFMEVFRDFLKEEGLPGNDSPHITTIKLNVLNDIGKRLKMLRPKLRKDTNESYSFPKHGPLIRLGTSNPNESLTPNIRNKRQRVILDRMPKLTSLLAKEVKEQQNIADAEPPSPKVFDHTRLSLVREDLLYLGLLNYIKSRGYVNLLIEQKYLKNLLNTPSWYEIYLPEQQWVLAMDNVILWQNIALELLSMLADRINEYNRKAYLEPRLEIVNLENADGNIPTQTEYQLIVDAGEKALIEDIEALKIAFEVENKEYFDSGHISIQGTHLDIHLYNPLLSARSDKIRIQPVGLQSSEFQLVNDLKAWLDQHRTEFINSEEQLYLLRNLVRKGIGFFEAGGFYPDFILWRVWKQGKQTQQRIVFVDPHGLQYEGRGSDKIEFSADIKSIESRLKKEIHLESVIISPPKTYKSEIAHKWQLSEQELLAKHVLFMADGPLYIDQLMKIVRK